MYPGYSEPSIGIDAVPVEIIQHIINLAIQTNSPSYGFKGTPMLNASEFTSQKDSFSDQYLCCDNTLRLSVTRVCRTWRDIVDNSPVLWSTITYSGRERVKDISDWIKKSSPTTLRIIISLPITSCHSERKRFFHISPFYHNADLARSELQGVFLALVDATNRIEHFSITTCCSIHTSVAVQTLPLFLGGEKLRTVAFEQRGECQTVYDTGVSTPLFRFSKINAGLQSLTLFSIPVDPRRQLPLWSLIDLNIELTVYDLGTNHWKILRTMLTNAQGLLSLRLVLPSFPAIFSGDTSLSLPNLTTFTLSIPVTIYTSTIFTMFEFPKLRDLSLIFTRSDLGCKWLANSFYKLGASAMNDQFPISNISTLILTYTPQNYRQLASFVGGLVNLATLVLHNVTDTPGTGPMLGYLLAFSVRVEMKRRRGITAALCCPNLTHIRTFHSIGFTEKALSCVRLRLSCPLTFRVSSEPA